MGAAPDPRGRRRVAIGFRVDEPADAFYLDHRQCGGPEAGLDGPVVWMSCSCGAVLVRVAPFSRLPPAILHRGAMRLIGLAVVLALSLALTPLAAQVQQAGKVPRKGFHLQRSDLGPTDVAITQGLDVQWRGPIAPYHYVCGED